MANFTQKTNPVTGISEWVGKTEVDDCFQEIARSAFADMLHDSERNEMFCQALKKAIDKFHQLGKEAIVLDIGTGTGFLAMAARRYGAERVYACEVFRPVAETAAKVIAQNNMEGQIQLIRKRSTEIQIGEDMIERANILIAEVFDTELIGEGALWTFKHAKQHLLTSDAVVVPDSGTVYIQAVESEKLWSWNTLSAVNLSTMAIQPPPSISQCTGAASVHDLQVDQIPDNWFKLLTTETPAFRFDFRDTDKYEFKSSATLSMDCVRSGTCHAFIMWWVLNMDEDGDILLGTYPRWLHPDPSNSQWRDHWMQAIYYPKQAFDLVKGDEVKIAAHHDEYSLWFDVQSTTSVNTRPVCTCGYHMQWSRCRLHWLNDSTIQETYLTALKNVITKDSVCLVVSDGSLLSVMAAKLGAQQVYVVEKCDRSAKLLSNILKVNGCKDNVKIIVETDINNLKSSQFDNRKITVLLSEPYFHSSYLPWHNIHHWYVYSSLHRADLLHTDCTVLPVSASLKAVAVQMKDLHKIRAKVGMLDGLDIKPFDDILRQALQYADENVEPQPMWEYPSTALSVEHELMRFKFTDPSIVTAEAESQGVINISRTGTCNGIVLWMDYHLDEKTILSTGLQKAVDTAKDYVEDWVTSTKQGVYFYEVPLNVGPLGGDCVSQLKYNVKFNSEIGELQFKFSDDVHE